MFGLDLNRFTLIEFETYKTKDGKKSIKGKKIAIKLKKFHIGIFRKFSELSKILDSKGTLK
jgi:hypothetical protein